MTYRDRRERRAEKRREWAEGREAKAEVAGTTAHEEVMQRPLGEPIHPGSAGRRQRAAIRRSQNATARAIEHVDMARKHRQSASTIESQLERSVYDDDPDATERLRERISENEAKREAMKARNAGFRTANREKLKELTSYQRDRAMPHRAFELSNLGTRITRDRKRLRSLEAAT